MTLTTIKSDKSKCFLLSEQVKNHLQEKGFLKVFNYPDYHHFKNQVQEAFNKSYAIAEIFISDNEGANTSDFNDYIF